VCKNTFYRAIQFYKQIIRFWELSCFLPSQL